MPFSRGSAGGFFTISAPWEAQTFFTFEQQREPLGDGIHTHISPPPSRALLVIVPAGACPKLWVGMRRNSDILSVEQLFLIENLLNHFFPRTAFG